MCQFIGVETALKRMNHDNKCFSNFIGKYCHPLNQNANNRQIIKFYLFTRSIKHVMCEYMLVLNIPNSVDDTIIVR